MSEKYEIVPATYDIALEMAPKVREADQQEVWAASHQTPLEALIMGLQQPGETWAGLADGRAFCMFGCGQWSVLSLMGIPWLLTTEELPKHAKVFLRTSHTYFEDLRSRYMLLQNYVDARHEMSIRWLTRFGFILDDPLPFGIEQLPFHRFHWRAN